MAVACLCALDWFGDLWVTLGLLVVPLTTYICDIIYKLMTELTPELLEKNHDKILTLTGQDSFLNWNDFEASSRKVVEAVDALNKEISIFREAQQIYFIQNMKKMKGADLPDMFKAVKANKLHPKALKSIVSRFRLNGEDIELAEPLETLKQEAQESLSTYVSNNTEIIQHLQSLKTFLNERVTKYDFKQEIIPRSQQTQKHEFKNKFPENEVQSACNQIQIMFIPGTDSLIGLKTYAQVAEMSVNLCGSAYASLTEETRKKQREIINNPKEYLAVMTEYLSLSEGLITDAQLSIVSKLGIPINKFEESETLLMERGLTHNILTIQTVARTKLKDKIKATKSITLDQSQDILNYQIDLISKKSDFIKDVLSGIPKTPEATQVIPILLTFILNDLVFEKYHYEEEDFMQNINEETIGTNPELMNLFHKMESSIIELMKKLGLVPEGLGSDFDPSMLGMGIPPGMLPPSGNNQPKNSPPLPGLMPPMGLMPGADPLAYQQMQAQLQMLSKKK